MKKEHISPVVGTLAGTAVCWALIRFWIADFASKAIGVARGTAYAALMTLLVLLHGWRIIIVLRGNDDVTKRISRWLNK